ncbi:MAG: hypothetical protein QOG33_1314, partial [Gaiellales bacterium]|nr:hypothetical protein [Gaiellales bacterium]
GLAVGSDAQKVHVRVHVPAVIPGLDLSLGADADLVRQ